MPAPETPIADLPNFGKKSAEALNAVGLHTFGDLEAIGAINAYLRLKEQSDMKPSLNFLYALVGAIRGVHWQQIAQEEKYALLMELEAREAIEEDRPPEP